MCRHVTTIWHYNDWEAIYKYPLNLSPRTFHMVQRAITTSVMQYTLDIPFITWSMPVSLHQGFSFYAVLDMHPRYGNWVDLNDIILYIKKWNIPSRGIKLLGFIECVNSSNLFYRYWNKTKLHEHLSLNREKDCKVLVYRTMFRIAYGPL